MLKLVRNKSKKSKPRVILKYSILKYPHFKRIIEVRGIYRH